MLKKIVKKVARMICVVGIAFILSNAIGGLKTAAAEFSIASKGNVIMRQTLTDGTITTPVAIYSSDISYLKNEISNLRSQL